MLGIAPSILTHIMFGALGGILGVLAANRIREHYQKLAW